MTPEQEARLENTLSTLTESVNNHLAVVNKQSESIDRLMKWSATVEQRCCDHTKRTEDVEVVLFGKDRRDGIVKDVSDLQASRETITKEAGFKQQIMLALISGIFPSAVLAVVGWLLFMWKIH